MWFESTLKSTCLWHKILALSVKARVRNYINNDFDDLRYAGAPQAAPSFLLTLTICKHEKDTQHLFYQQESTYRCRTSIHIATGALRAAPSFYPVNFQKHWLWNLLCTSFTSSPQWLCSLSSVQMLLSGSTMLKKIPFFKKSVYRAEILPLLIFRSIMIAVQIVCVVVLLVGTFEVALNNIGAPVSGSLGTLNKIEWLSLTSTDCMRDKGVRS